MSTKAQLAALRAAHLARMGAMPMPPAVATSASATATAAATAAAAASAASSAPGKAAAAAAPPAAEDAANDGGESIDTFSAYVPSALPSCLVKALEERQREKEEQNLTAASASASASNLASAATLSSNSASNDINDQQGKSSTSKADDDSDDSVIEILDTEDEDSRMGAKGEGDGDGGPKSASANGDSDIDANINADTNSNVPAEDNEPSDREQHMSSTRLYSSVPSHTSPAVESALLSSVAAPPVPDEAARTIMELVKDGQLSPLQAEGVALAINRFRRVFTGTGTGTSTVGAAPGTRAGFFLGDGAGIGKGRQIGATIRDALCRDHGRGRHLWISVSRELVQDARRDLGDVGCHVDVHDGADVLDQMSPSSSSSSSSSASSNKKSKGLGTGGSLGKGVLFITYSLLVSGKRMENIISWLAGEEGPSSTTKAAAASSAPPADAAVERAQRAQLMREKRMRLERSYSGLIVFDEAHKAKNLEQDTRTARLVLALQERLPNARVLYCSATGVSHVYANLCTCKALPLESIEFSWCDYFCPPFFQFTHVGERHQAHGVRHPARSVGDGQPPLPDVRQLQGHPRQTRSWGDGNAGIGDVSHIYYLHTCKALLLESIKDS